MAKTKKSAKKKRLDTLSVKTREQKEKLLEEFARNGIVQMACNRTGTGRSTYYKWRKDDSEFGKLADKAIHEGKFLVNDVAESMLQQKIKEGHMTAIIFWLKNHHPDYSEHILHRHEIVEPELTSEQSETIGNALAKIGLANIIMKGKLDMKTVKRLLPKAEKILAPREAEEKKEKEDWLRAKNKFLGTAPEEKEADNEEIIKEGGEE